MLATDLALGGATTRLPSPMRPILYFNTAQTGPRFSRLHTVLTHWHSLFTVFTHVLTHRLSVFTLALGFKGQTFALTPCDI